MTEVTDDIFEDLASAIALSQRNELLGANLQKHKKRALDNLRAASDLSSIQQRRVLEPVRTLHHLSCTGGTVISKCIASMANTCVLNEIQFRHAESASLAKQSNFSPTDITALLRQADIPSSANLLSGLFLSNVEFLRDALWRSGRILVLRDHSHTQFLTQTSLLTKPTLRDLTAARLPVCSVVTVRDPIDSYLSLVHNGWHKTFSPANFDEYCRRYLIFLRAFSDVPIFKYENFVAQPKSTMQQICDALNLTYFEAFDEVFDSFRFSGDSGRSGAVIAERGRREVSEVLKSEAAASKNYATLVRILSYTTEFS